MVQTIYRLEVIREFKTKAEAVKAAERQERLGDRKVTIAQEHRTDSGQPFNREVIWRDEDQLRSRLEATNKRTAR